MAAAAAAAATETVTVSGLIAKLARMFDTKTPEVRERYAQAVLRGGDREFPVTAATGGVPQIHNTLLSRGTFSELEAHIKSVEELLLTFYAQDHTYFGVFSSQERLDRRDGMRLLLEVYGGLITPLADYKKLPSGFKQKNQALVAQYQALKSASTSATAAIHSITDDADDSAAAAAAGAGGGSGGAGAADDAPPTVEEINVLVSKTLATLNAMTSYESFGADCDDNVVASILELKIQNKLNLDNQCELLKFLAQYGQWMVESQQWLAHPAVTQKFMSVSFQHSAPDQAITDAQKSIMTEQIEAIGELMEAWRKLTLVASFNWVLDQYNAGETRDALRNHPINDLFWQIFIWSETEWTWNNLGIDRAVLNRDDLNKAAWQFVSDVLNYWVDEETGPFVNGTIAPQYGRVVHALKLHADDAATTTFALPALSDVPARASVAFSLGAGGGAGAESDSDSDGDAHSEASNPAYR